MSKMQLSIIIPAYNAEKFIQRAITSILKQGLQQEKFEIIIVENGSTDNTTNIIEHMIQIHKNIKLFHSPKGVSNARNVGIEQAQGEWILFLDADDILLENVLSSILFDINKTKSDLYFYGHKNNNEERLVCDNQKEEVFDASTMEACKVKVLKNPTRYMQAYAKIYRQDFLKSNKLKFNPKLRLSEDSDFCFRCLQMAKKVEFKNTIMYRVLPNLSSTMRSFDGEKEKDYIFALQETKKLVYLENREVQHAFDFYILMHMNIAMVRENFCLNNKANFWEKYKNMKCIVKEPIFREAMDRVQKKECFSLRMAPILCLKLYFQLGASIIYTIRALQNYLREK